MPVHKIVSDANRFQLWLDSGGPKKDADISKILMEEGGDNLRVAARLKQETQDAIDVRIKRSDMPKEDEAARSNPRREDFFWDGQDLVARSVIVEDVAWDGTRYGPTLRKARQWH